MIDGQQQWTGQALEGDLRRRTTGRHAGVEVADHLRADAAEVDGHLIAVDDDPDVDLNVLAERHRVVVHERLCFVNTVRDLLHGRAGKTFALFGDQLHALPERVVAVAREQLQQAALAGPDRRDLRTKIAHRAIRIAAVGANESR